jgi:hypothetical protein
LQPENDRPPRKGVHICHVLVLFPVDQQPWKALAGWMRTAANPFPKGSWIVCSGRILGVLDRELIHGPQLIDSSVRIPVILPDNWELIRQSTLSPTNTSTPTSSKASNQSPTTSRPAGPRGFTTRNPFSSPSRARRPSPQKEASRPTLPSKHPKHDASEPPATPEAPPNSPTIDVDPALTISSSGMTPPSSSPTRLTANEIPITPTMVQTQSSCWKINSLQVPPPQQGRGRSKAFPSRSEARGPQRGKRRRGCMTRSCQH